jgi:hypothetical protein
MYLWSLPEVIPPSENIKSILAEGCSHLTALPGFAGNFFDEARKATKDDSR